MITGKSLELVRSFSGVDLFGELVTWSCGGVKVSYHQVLAALKAADLDQNVARKLLPRNAFKRACKELSRNRVIREVKELSSVSELVFQFTAETKGDDQKFRYEIEALVRINRETGRIDCEQQELKDRAQGLLDDAIEGRTGSDVTRIIQRLFEQNADLFPVRDRGGIYFVPIAFREFVNKIQVLMGKIGGSLDRWPIPAGMVESKASVKDSLTAGLDKSIQDHFDAIDLFSESTRADTFQRHEAHIETTRFKLEAYKELLEDRKDALEAALNKAREKLLARMAGMFSDFDEDLPEKSPVSAAEVPVQGAATTFKVPTVDIPAQAPVTSEECGEDLWESEDRYEVPEADEPEPEAIPEKTGSSAQAEIDAMFDWV